MRRGIMPDRIQSIQLKDSFDFLGFFTSNSAIGFFISIIAGSIIFTPLCWPLLWKMLYEKILLIVVLLVMVIVGNICNFLSEKYLTDEGLIVNRRFWGIYEIYLLYLSFAEGVVAAFGRFIALIKYSFFMIYRLDRPMFADYLLDIANFDIGYKVYLGILLIYHRYNHPIMITAAKLFCLFIILFFN